MDFLNIMCLAVVKRMSGLTGKAGYMFKYFFLPGLCALYLPATLFAASPEIRPADMSWGFWFRSQISQHPDVIAAKERMYAALSVADSLDQPLYNPKLDTEYEREGRYNNYRLGLSQKLDWWDKRGARKKQAVFGRIAARQSYQLIVQQKSAETLQALVEWRSARRESVLALQQETQLGTLLDLVEHRQRSGDLGQVDVELAFLSLSQKLNNAAQAQARIKRAESRLEELLPGWSEKQARIPEQFWAIGERRNIDQWVDKYPSVAAAKADWQVSKKKADLARLRRKAEPTVGLNGGKSTGDTIIGLTLTIPLNIRNDFTAEARAARRQALAAEANYRSVRRKQQAAVRATAATLNVYQKRYHRWQKLMRGRGESSGKLLEMQWRSGDMGTTEYLLALQQRTEGLIAGIELHAQFHMARIEWLLQTGQMENALMQLKR